MEKCFVIQPFDKDKFDKRYQDIFKPAINEAGFEAYRIDQDPGVKVPINEIETGISQSRICFADITNDNPNVWYELGYAFACDKDVVMVCSEERQGKYPFDIQHRHIITYKTGSTSDYDTLKQAITVKIVALIEKSKTVQKLNTTPIVETEGLKSHEIALLILLMQNQIGSDFGTSAFTLRDEMEKSGYTQLATSIGITNLVKSGMIETSSETDHWSNHEFKNCKLTEKGQNWILANQHRFQFRKPVGPPVVTIDELPF